NSLAVAATCFNCLMRRFATLASRSLASTAVHFFLPAFSLFCLRVGARCCQRLAASSAISRSKANSFGGADIDTAPMKLHDSATIRSEGVPLKTAHFDRAVDASLPHEFGHLGLARLRPFPIGRELKHSGTPSTLWESGRGLSPYDHG